MQLYQRFKRDLKKNMDESRYEHTLGVMYTAGALAMRYECDLDKCITGWSDA